VLLLGFGCCSGRHTRSLTHCIAQINGFGLLNFKMLDPALLACVLGQWLLGPVGLDREREIWHTV